MNSTLPSFFSTGPRSSFTVGPVVLAVFLFVVVGQPSDIDRGIADSLDSVCFLLPNLFCHQWLVSFETFGVATRCDFLVSRGYFAVLGL